MDCDVVLLGLMDWNAATGAAPQQHLIPLPATASASDLCYELLTPQTPTPYFERTRYMPSESSHSSDQQNLSATNLYIKNLEESTTDETLRQLVEGCGDIKSLKAIMDKEKGVCKGFGFIDFQNSEDAQKAIAKLKQLGKSAQLAKSTQQQEQDTTNLYFANLDLSMQETELKDALTQAGGTVVSVRILRDPQKNSRGVGFARLDNRDQCTEVISRFHQKSFPDYPDKIVHVKFADASNKNKRMYKSALDDGKGGPPLYSNPPLDGSHYGNGVQSPTATLYQSPPWIPHHPVQQQAVHNQQQQQNSSPAPQPTYGFAPIPPPQPPTQQQQQAQRTQLPVFNHPAFLQPTHHEGPFALPLIMNGLQIAPNGGTFQLHHMQPAAFQQLNGFSHLAHLPPQLQQHQQHQHHDALSLTPQEQLT